MYLQSNREILTLSFTSNKSDGDGGFHSLDQVHHQDLNLVVIDCGVEEKQKGVINAKTQGEKPEIPTDPALWKAC